MVARQVHALQVLVRFRPPANGTSSLMVKRTAHNGRNNGSSPFQSKAMRSSVGLEYQTENLGVRGSIPLAGKSMYSSIGRAPAS